MKGSIALFITVVLLASCSPQRRLYTLLKNHPELARTDSVMIRDTVITSSVKVDTVLNLKTVTDTLVIEKGKFKVKILVKRDSVFVKGECDADTIYVERKVAYTTITPVKPVTWFTRLTRWAGNILMIIIVLAIGLVIGFFGGRIVK